MSERRVWERERKGAACAYQSWKHNSIELSWSDVVKVGVVRGGHTTLSVLAGDIELQSNISLQVDLI